MEQYSNGYRYKDYVEWCDLKHVPYDYERHGLINKILSRKIIESNNKILKVILLYYEKSFVLLLKYVDELKHFKDPHWKNR